MTKVRSLISAGLLAAAVVAGGCGSPVVGTCTTPTATPTTLADGGSVTCYCEGPCGCFTAPDSGVRCP